MAVQTAIWGSRASGKTTLAVKLADELSKKGSVIVVFCDTDVPVLPALFPAYKESELPSLGTALSSVEITEEKILASAVVSASENIVYLGYSVGENLYSYPSFGAARADCFIELLGRMADFVIYDCPSVTGGKVLAVEALKKSDVVFRLCTPDIMSFLFFSSQLPLLTAEAGDVSGHRNILSCPEGEICLPESEALAYMKECDVRLGHCRQIKQFWADGTLPGSKPGKAYSEALKKAAAAVYAASAES